MFEGEKAVTPAFAGLVVLGRPAPGQLVATAVDLALRGLIAVRRSDTWEARPAEQAAAGDRLARYEQALVSWMMPDGEPFVLRDVDADRVAALDPVVDQLMADARRLRLFRRRLPWPWSRRSERLSSRGEQWAEQGTQLRTRLRTARPDPEQLRETLAYLVVFGLHTGPRMGAASPEVARLAAFATAWHQACADLPGWRPPPPEKPDDEVPNTDRQFTPGIPPGMGGLASGGM